MHRRRTAGGWLTVSAATARTPAEVRSEVNPAGLTVGSYTGWVTITGPGTGAGGVHGGGRFDAGGSDCGSAVRTGKVTDTDE